MHPGPMNRGVEIDTKLADDINVSLVKEQVESVSYTHLTLPTILRV